MLTTIWNWFNQTATMPRCPVKCWVNYWHSYEGLGWYSRASNMGMMTLVGEAAADVRRGENECLELCAVGPSILTPLALWWSSQAFAFVVLPAWTSAHHHNILNPQLPKPKEGLFGVHFTQCWFVEFSWTCFEVEMGFVHRIHNTGDEP